jgi:TRAP-type C4-dicarboxylate transport system permease small subunit
LNGGAPAAGPIGRTLAWACRALVWWGGLLLLAIVGVSVLSISGRWLANHPIGGDYEMVQVGCAAAVSAFLPYCQWRRGNIIVDFFTTRAGPRLRRRLDGAGALLLALMLALLAWRSGAGLLDARANNEATMLLGFPLWIGYAAMLPGLVLSAAVALQQSITELLGRQG